MKIFFGFFLFLSFQSTGQKVSGTVFNTQGDVVPYASITIKGTSTGTSANGEGKFSFNITSGTYTIICQSLGYSTSEKQAIVNGDIELTFILQKQVYRLPEVVVKNNSEDPAYEIIRQAIKKRNVYENQVNAFSCDLYTKDLIRMYKMPDRIFGKKIKREDKAEMGVDSVGRGIVYLSESFSKAHKQKPDKLKLEVISSRVSGSDSYGLTFPAFIFLYTNNVKIFTERFNPRGFVSPIADGALHYYKFRFLGSFFEDGKMINAIRVTPRRLYEPLFSGTINITDGDWRIHSFDLLLTKKSQLEFLDTLNLTQLHVPVGNDIWKVKSQLLHFNFSVLGIEMAGNFQSVYSNYNLSPSFSKKFFDRIIIKYDTAASKRPKNYWDSIRPVPLGEEELHDYQKKDSAFKALQDSSKRPVTLDSLNKRQPKVKPWDIFLSGIHRSRFIPKNVINWGVESLAKNFEYNTVEGAVIKLKGYYSRQLKFQRKLDIDPVVRYGFSNKHFTAFADLSISGKRRDTRNTFTISGGRRVSSLNNISTFPVVLKNTVSTLFFGNNFLKIYQNDYGAVSFHKSYESGFSFQLSGLFESRQPLENTSTFTFRKRDSAKLTPNFPLEKMSSNFLSHDAAIFSIDISLKPGQRYIQFPNFRLPLGSKYPLFNFNYTKGIKGLLNSDVDFDKWKFSVSDKLNLKLAGTFLYKASVGGFINARKVFIQDYQHFNGNPTRSASDYVNSFQLAGYYTNSTTTSFYSLAHIEHHFNGLLTNKIPLFRKLNWNAVAGSNAFFVNRNSNYAEIFAGLENIFKVLRIDFVAGYVNGNKGVTGVRIGGGGALGGGVKANAERRGNSIQLSF